MPRADDPTIADALVDWFADAARPLPWRAADVSPWAVLVSEFMLQQTQVARVVPLWEAWIRRWPTAAALAAEPPSEAVRAWDRLGYPRRALWLHRAAVEIVERPGGEVPADLDALLALQGVGPYTARAVAAFAFGLRYPVVDTNTRRVIARVVGGEGEPGPPSTPRDLAAIAALRGMPDRRPLRVACGGISRLRGRAEGGPGPFRGVRPSGARAPHARTPCRTPSRGTVRARSRLGGWRATRPRRGRPRQRRGRRLRRGGVAPSRGVSPCRARPSTIRTVASTWSETSGCPGRWSGASARSAARLLRRRVARAPVRDPP